MKQILNAVERTLYTPMRDQKMFGAPLKQN
jgi:hypothetical protein